MAMTQAAAQAHLDQWLAADLAVATGQSYSIAGRALTRVDTSTIRDQIAYWQRTVDALAGKAAGARQTGHSVASWA